MPNPASSNGQAVVEFELTVPNSRPILLKADVVNHEHSSLVETIYGLCVYNHRLRTLNTEFVDQQLKDAMAAATPRIRFRLGYGTPSNIFWLPWQEHVVTFFSAILESIGGQAGHTIEMETQDLQFLMTRGSKFAARKGSISRIVNEIASSYDFGENVIEETHGEGLYVQSAMDDAEFIRKRMIRRARNDKGRGNYLFYFKDNALHFHSPDYQGELHTVSYFQATGAALTQIDHSQKLIDQGVSGTKVLAYDPYTGQTNVAASDPAHALRLSDSIYDYSKIDADLQIPYHQSANFAQEAEVIGQNTYEHSRSETLALRLEVDKTIQIRHGDFINLIVTPSDSKASPWSGFYLVSEVQHVVLKGSVRSVYTLARGEIRKSLVNLTSTQSDEILIIEQDAPGQDLNVGELKSSQRTKGAGNLAGDGRIFSTVQSPN
jgi:hypothetical protein